MARAVISPFTDGSLYRAFTFTDMQLINNNTISPWAFPKRGYTYYRNTGNYKLWDKPRSPGDRGHGLPPSR